MAVQRNYPSTLNADGTAVVLPSRTGQDGSAYAVPVGASNWSFADEGTYFVANNATLATGIAGHAAPVVADTDTKALFFLYNPATSSKRIILDYLFLEVTAAGTGGTINYTTVYVDNAAATARSSGGTAITPVNTASSAASAAVSSCYFGAVVTAMTSSRKVGQQIVREVIPVVQDTILMKFGSPNAGERSALTTAGTATCHVVQHFAPIVLLPGMNLNISQIRPSQSAAASYQFSAGWVER